MAIENFNTIPSTTELSNDDKFLIGTQNGDRSITTADVKKNMTPEQDVGFKLLIFYGIPIAINGAWSVPLAAMEFSFWDHIILGAGLEDPLHAEHTNTTNIITELKKIKSNIKIYGYIDVGVITDNHSQAEMETKTDNWLAMGATDIFLDDMGYDFQVSRSRQNAIINYIHSKGAKAFVNAWNPDDLFSSSVNATYNVSGEATAAQAGDIYLSESFIYNSSSYVGNDGFALQYNFKDKEDKVINYTKTLGIHAAAVDLYSGAFNYEDHSKITVVASLLMGKKMFGFMKEDYSASNSIVEYFEYFPEEIYKKVYTENVNYKLDGNWTQYERKQSGISMNFYIENNTSFVCSLIPANNIYGEYTSEIAGSGGGGGGGIG